VKAERAKREEERNNRRRKQEKGRRAKRSLKNKDKEMRL
jgi:hypothetical protein